MIRLKNLMVLVFILMPALLAMLLLGFAFDVDGLPASIWFMTNLMPGQELASMVYPVFLHSYAPTFVVLCFFFLLTMAALSLDLILYHKNWKE